MQERLQKVLARAGFASRRGAEQLIDEGRVTVNGEVVREPGTKADPSADDIRVDGVRVKAAAPPVYIVLHKPRGVVTTRRDPAGRRTVMDLVPGVAGLFPVGRLDVTTEGLILLTNDGAFAERVAHPRYEVPRVYHAKVHRAPDARALERLQRGIRIDGELLKADRVRVLDAGNNPWLELTLHEGKQHEVRRLLEAVGHPVSKLRRVAIGPVLLKGLETGEFRALRPEEVAGLLRGESAPPTTVRPPRRARPTFKRTGSPATPPRARAAGPIDKGMRRPAEGKGRSARVPSWAGRRGETDVETPGHGSRWTEGGARGRQDRAESRGRKTGRDRGAFTGRSGASTTGGRDQQDRAERGGRKGGQGRARSAGRSHASTTGGRGHQDWADRRGHVVGRGQQDRIGRGQKGGRGRGGSGRRSGGSAGGERGGQERGGRAGTGSRGRRR